MNPVFHHKLFRPAVGGLLTALCGLVLWLGDTWENASFDTLFRFGARPLTNKLTLVLANASRCRRSKRLWIW